MTWSKGGGVAVGFGGVAFLIGPEALSGLDGPMLGQLAIVAATVSYAFAGIFGKRMVHYDPAASAAGMLLGATIMSLPLAFVLGDPFAGMTDLTALAGIFGLGTVSTALAYLLYFRILNSAGATNLLLVTLLIPVSAGFLGVAFLGEVFTSDAFWGMGLIALGLIAVDGRLLRRKT